MSYYHDALLALLAGVVTGALILGIAGHTATVGIALITGNSLNLNLRGVLEVVTAGTLVDAVGGVLLLIYRLEGGKVTEEWEQMDSLGMLKQLGLLSN